MLRPLLVASLLFPLVTACGDDAKTPVKRRIAIVYDLVGKGDKSFNDMAAAGYTRALAELDLTGIELEPSDGGLSAADAVAQAADDADLVVGVGFAFAPIVAEVAPTHPDVHFAVIDGEGPELPNVTYQLFAANEGSFLVGAAAALTSTSKTFGFIGGVDVPVIDGFEDGFRAGVSHITADAVFDSIRLSQAPDFSGFGDPDKAKAEALRMYGAGSQVVFHAAGGSGSGLFEAAAEVSAAGDDVWAIGVDADQYQTAEPGQQPYILTSMLKRIDVAVFALADDLVHDRLKGGTKVGDLKGGLVGYATSGGHLSGIAAQLDALADQIRAGTIVVPE